MTVSYMMTRLPQRISSNDTMQLRAGNLHNILLKYLFYLDLFLKVF